MKLVLLRSAKSGTAESGPEPDEKYIQKLDTHFAERVLGNLESDINFCTACGPDCTFCREPYNRAFEKDIAGVIDFPDVMRYVLENPAEYVPADVPANDVLLVINIHEQVLLEILKRCGEWGTRGVVVPLEEPGWVCGATREQAHAICERNGIEIAFPKPFCSFKPPSGTVLGQFREHFHIGYPDVRIDVEDGEIIEAHVNVSAACGATYCVARWLAGRNVDENLEIEVISKRWHSYPCTASMERDPELGGETALHMAGQAHYTMLSAIKDKVAGLESPMVTSPLGRMVQRPVAPKENLRNIEDAKELILAALEKNPSVRLDRIRKARNVSPAAVNSALIILKQEGRIRLEEGVVMRG